MKILSIFLTVTLIILQYSCSSLNTVNIQDKKINLEGYVIFSNFRVKAENQDKFSDTTVSLIEMTSKEHNTVAMTVADQTGKFEFDKTINYFPKENDIFIIEATRRNNENNKTSLRTNAVWRNNKFETITAPNIFINAKTTAVSLISELKPDKLNIIDTIGTLTENNGQLNINNINESISSDYIEEVTSLVNESVNNNTDPISDISINSGTITSSLKKYTNVISGCKDISNCGSYITPIDNILNSDPLPVNLTSSIGTNTSSNDYVVKGRSGNFAVITDDTITVFDKNANVVVPTSNLPTPYHENRSYLNIEKVLLSKDSFYIIYQLRSYDHTYDPVSMTYTYDYDDIYIQKYSFNFEELGDPYLLKNGSYNLYAEMNEKEHLLLFYGEADKFYRRQMFFEIFDLVSRKKLSDQYLVISTSEDLANINVKFNNNDIAVLTWCTNNSLYMTSFNKNGKQLLYSNIGSPNIPFQRLFFRNINSEIKYKVEINDFDNIVVLYENNINDNYIKGKYFNLNQEKGLDFAESTTYLRNSRLSDLAIDKYGNFWFSWSQDYETQNYQNISPEERNKYKDGLFTLKIDSLLKKSFEKINLTESYPLINLNKGAFDSGSYNYGYSYSGNFYIQDGYIVVDEEQNPRFIWKEYKYTPSYYDNDYSYITRKINKYGKL